MNRQLEQAFAIMDEITAKYGKFTSDTLQMMDGEDILKMGKMWELLLDCPETSYILTKENAYNLLKWNLQAKKRLKPSEVAAYEERIAL